MLVLTRKPGERIMIGDEISIQLVEAKQNGTVRLGIIAPREIPVHREEVFHRIKATSERKLAETTSVA